MDSTDEHGNRYSDVDVVSLASSRKAEEAVNRRYEATRWLRKMVGIVASKDLPNQPSEEEFRNGLRNGLILCNVMNKVIPGTIPKVVDNPAPSAPPPDGAPLSAYQYFENVRNFLVAVQEMSLPSFEARDLEKGGSTVKVVDCVLALKAYHDWKQSGGTGIWRYGGNAKLPQSIPRPSVKSGTGSDPFTASISKSIQASTDLNDSSSQLNLKSPEGQFTGNVENHDQLFKGLGMDAAAQQQALMAFILALFSERKPEGSILVDSVVGKVAEELGRKMAATPGDQLTKVVKDIFSNGDGEPSLKPKIWEACSSIPLYRKVGEGNSEQQDETPTRQDLETDLSNVVGHQYFPSNLHAICDLQRKEIRELRSLLTNAKKGLRLMKTEWSQNINNLERHMCGLTKAAEGYHKVLEENRRLYNQVQDLKGSIRVYCRVRPFLPGQSNAQSTVDFIGEDGSIMIVNPAKKGKEARRTFTFNKVFGEAASQEEVFWDTQPLIRSVLDGYNVCIFAYGQTGSGKTYTMTGPKVITGENCGVNYRALNDLFQISKQRRDTCVYEVGVQMIEIYNEQVRDLLASDGSNRRLEIRNNSQQNGLNVPDANLISVSSTSAVTELMNLGQKNRAVGATALNDRSSRSHSVLTVHVQGRDLTSGAVLRGCLHLVDLAGSERVDKSEATGDRLKEAQHINRSLSALGDVIAALAQKNSHVPYRNSKLTQLLQDSLGGQAKTLMFVHISPEVDALGETISTLKFAERVATVELGAARSNKESGEIRELKEQIAQLKNALAKKESDVGVGEMLIRATPDLQKLRGVSPTHLHQNVGNSVTKANQRQPMENVINVQNSAPTKTRRASFDQSYASELLNVSAPMLSNTFAQIHKPLIRAASGTKLTRAQGSRMESGITPDIFEEKGMAKWQESLLAMQHSELQDAMKSWNTRDLGKIDDHSTIYCESYQGSPDCEEERFSLEPLHNLQDVTEGKKQDMRRNDCANGQKTPPYDVATTDESEVEIDARSKDEYMTSDSSEADLLWQYRASNTPSPMSNEHMSLTKKPQQMTAKASERRRINPGPLLTARSERRSSAQLQVRGIETKKTLPQSKLKHEGRSRK